MDFVKKIYINSLVESFKDILLFLSLFNCWNLNYCLIVWILIVWIYNLKFEIVVNFKFEGFWIK